MTKRLCWLLLLLPLVAYSTPPSKTQKQSQHQSQQQTSAQEQSVTVNVGGGVDADGQAAPLVDTGDVSLQSGDTTLNGGDTNFNSESNNTNVVLVPNNNTESCLRVFGLSFGNSSGAGGIGYPWRSSACDFEQAADDAAAIGDHTLAWFWRCHKKNVHKPFRKEGMTKQDAVQACHEKMVSFLSHSTMQQRIDQLEREKATLMDLREHERAVCDESVERCRQELMKALGGPK